MKMKINKTKSPPRLAEWLLKIIANYNNNSAIVGDLEEEYSQNLKLRGSLYALLQYLLVILLSLPSFLINRIYWSVTINILNNFSMRSDLKRYFLYVTII